MNLYSLTSSNPAAPYKAASYKTESQVRDFITQDTKIFFGKIALFALDPLTILNMTELLVASSEEGQKILDNPKQYRNFSVNFVEIAQLVKEAKQPLSELMELKDFNLNNEYDLKFDSTISREIHLACHFLTSFTKGIAIRFYEDICYSWPFQMEPILQFLFLKTFQKQNTISKEAEDLFDNCIPRIRRIQSKEEIRRQEELEEQRRESARRGMYMAPLDGYIFLSPEEILRKKIDELREGMANDVRETMKRMGIHKVSRDQIHAFRKISFAIQADVTLIEKLLKLEEGSLEEVAQKSIQELSQTLAKLKRTGSLDHHPDKGGDKENFQILMNAIQSAQSWCEERLKLDQPSNLDLPD